MKEGLKNFALYYRDEVLLFFGAVIMTFTVTIFIISLAGVDIPEFVQVNINTLFTVGFSCIAGSSVLGMFNKQKKHEVFEDRSESPARTGKA